MPVGLTGLPVMHAVPGIRWGVASAGIKKPGRRDVVLMEIAAGSSCAAVFTQNAFCAAPVVVAREHLARQPPRWLLINTGNANAGTGAQGIKDAQACCAAVAEIVHGVPTQVLPFSTGVIGEPLPTAKIVGALSNAWRDLHENHWPEAATGIMTTDTVPKGASAQIELDGHRVTVTGIAKGAGMIRPDMATLLAYVATDAKIAPELLQRCLNDVVANSFNSITIDGDTSTNDACMLVATGHAGHALIEREDAMYRALCAAVTQVCESLAQAIVRDGEGATKFIRVEVNQGVSIDECRQVAYTIAHSPLVKTAFFASDPNWGRILAAVGRAGVENLNLDALSIYLDEICIVSNGGRAPDYEERLGQQVMSREEITVRVDLARGAQSARIWTCDFSYDYVRINAEYRT